MIKYCSLHNAIYHMYAQFKKQQCVMDFTVKRQVVRPHSGCGPDCRPTDIA